MAERNPELQKLAKQGEMAIKGSITQPDLSGATRTRPDATPTDGPPPDWIESIEDNEDGSTTIRTRPR